MMARTLPLVFAVLLLALLLAACSSASLSRDLDVTGTLPSAIGLGAFAPNCIFFCFVTATITQGDTAAINPAVPTNPATLRVRHSSDSDLK